MTTDLEDAIHGGTIKRTLKRLQGLYAIVWLEIIVLAILCTLMAWTLFYAMDTLREIISNDAQIAELVEMGGKA